jgi:hypothetical protein
VDCEKSGMADMVFEMIQDADIDTRAEYYKHIVLSGTVQNDEKHMWCEKHPCLLRVGSIFVSVSAKA